MNRAKRGLLYLSVGTSQLLAVGTQYSQLATQLVISKASEEIAGVSVLSDQAQRLLLAATANQDRRMWALHRLRHVEWAFELIVLAHERRLVSTPHLVRDPQRLLQPLETLLQRRKGNAKTPMLLLVPCSANSEVGAAVREHVESGCSLDKHTWMAIRDASNHRAQAQAVGDASCESQRRPTLKHLILRWTVAPYLEKVIHHPKAVEASALNPARHGREGVVELALPVGIGEIVDLQADAHTLTSPC